MLDRIKKELLQRAERCIDRYNITIDLKMKNNDYITVYLPSEKKSLYATHDFSILDNEDNLIKFNSLEDLAQWIINKYSKGEK